MEEQVINGQRCITISDYVKHRGVSKQTVYSQLQKGLTPYVVDCNGKRYLRIEVLDYIPEKTSAKRKNTAHKRSTDKESVNQQKSTEKEEINQEPVDQKPKDMTAFLMDQLAEKDRQISEKDKQISEMQHLMSELNDRMSELTTSLQMQGYQLKALQAHVEKLLPAPKEEIDVVDVEEITDEAADQDVDPDTVTEEPSQESAPVDGAADEIQEHRKLTFRERWNIFWRGTL